MDPITRPRCTVAIPPDATCFPSAYRPITRSAGGAGGTAGCMSSVPLIKRSYYCYSPGMRRFLLCAAIVCACGDDSANGFDSGVDGGGGDATASFTLRVDPPPNSKA